MDMQKIEDICASVAHEANRLYCKEINDSPQVRWEDTTSELKGSVLCGVREAIKGRSPEQLHESWLSYKESKGWKYGAFKNEDKKEHPCFMPYDELPAEQKLKDALFSNIVNAVHKSLPKT